MSSTSYVGFYQENLPFSSIRLLRLLPHREKAAPVWCEIFHYPLSERDVQTHPYDALSYVWGSCTGGKSIYIRAQGSSTVHNLPVTDKLYQALVHLRYTHLERIIWIDAVCINQENTREKEQQIRFMSQIYGQANRVVVWLGESADDSSGAIQEIRRAGRYKSTDLVDFQVHQQAITALLHRSWFRRIWVLQEVAAARHVLLVCGDTEIDGYAFCLGLESFGSSERASAELLGMVRSVMYLIKGSIFREAFSVMASNRITLNICTLGELMDMYHAHEATQRHDKVYALLGMSTDDISRAGLQPDYSLPWKTLLERLVKYLTCQQVLVETWEDHGQFAVIRSRGYLIGSVSSVEDNLGRSFRDGIRISVTIKERTRSWAVQSSAKPIQDGDMICLLEGASTPMLIRPCYDYFEIILIKVTVSAYSSLVEGDGNTFRDFLLVWDWEKSSSVHQRQQKFEGMLEQKSIILNYQSEKDAILSNATGLWNISLILGDTGDRTLAEERLKEAVTGYEIGLELGSSLLKSQYGLTPLCWAAGNGYESLVCQLLAKGKHQVDPDLKDSQYGMTPLAWAAKSGSATVIKLLLETQAVDINSRDEFDQTPLLLAAVGGHEGAVRLLLQTEEVPLNTKKDELGTAFLIASENGHTKVVKLLLETGIVEADMVDSKGGTALLKAADKGHVELLELLLQTGEVDINVEDNSGHRPLWRAARNGHEAVVKLLLDTERLDPDAKDLDGYTPLSRASEHGHESVVKALLETRKVDLNTRDNSGWTPLARAADGGHEAVVKMLLQTDMVDVDPKDDIGLTPIQRASENGHTAIVRLLLDTKKVDFDRRDNSGKTPLSIAAWRGHEDVCRLLLETERVDVDVSAKYDSSTPLYEAVRWGHESIVRLLLETEKVDVNVKCESYGKYTPLIRAAMCGYEGIVKLLLHTDKIDVNARNTEGNTALVVAADGGYDGIVKLLLETEKADIDTKGNCSWTSLSNAAGRGHEDVFKTLFNTGGVDVDSKGRYNESPLFRAAENGHQRIVKWLLETGRVEVDRKCFYDHTPLFVAAENGHEGIVMLLLETGQVQPDVRDKSNRTPLLKAAENGHAAVVELLLKTGKVQPDARDNYRKTPLMMAAKNGHEKVIRLLLETGKVDIGAKDVDDLTPMRYAARNENGIIFKLLQSVIDVERNDLAYHYYF